MVTIWSQASFFTQPSKDDSSELMPKVKSNILEFLVTKFSILVRLMFENRWHTFPNRQCAQAHRHWLTKRLPIVVVLPVPPLKFRIANFWHGLSVSSKDSLPPSAWALFILIYQSLIPNFSRSSLDITSHYLHVPKLGIDFRAFLFPERHILIVIKLLAFSSSNSLIMSIKFGKGWNPSFWSAPNQI